MQGRKHDREKIITSFQLSSRIPKDNFYRRLKETLDLRFLYEQTKACYGSTGNPSIDPVVFFKFMLIGYLENINSNRKLIERPSSYNNSLANASRRLDNRHIVVFGNHRIAPQCFT